MCKAGNLFTAVRSLKNKTMINTLLKSGLGTAVGNAASMPFNLMSMAIQSDMNKDLMNHQQKLNLQSFQHQIASTSIGAQVKRLKSLGLNPALALGTGVGSMSGQVGGTSLSGVSPSSPYVMSPAEVSQIENIDASTQKTNAETYRLNIANLYAVQQEVANLEVKKSEILERLSKVGANQALKSELEKSVQKFDQDISESRARMERISAEVDELGTRSALNVAETLELGTRSARNVAETGKTLEETKQLKANADVIRQGLVANVELSESQREYYLWMADKAELEGNVVQKELENYDINLYARLSQMTSQELRGWFDSVSKYMEEKEKAQKDGRFSNFYQKFLVARYILPLLLKK